MNQHPPGTSPCPGHAPLTDPSALTPTADIAHRLAADPETLAALVEDPSASLAERLTAGGMLALFGDPRIAPTPRTCPVPGGTVQLGLPAECVAAVAADWAHVGVDTAWIAKETPAHPVELADYWIAAYPVTNSEYRTFLHATSHPRRPTTWYLGAYPYDRSNHPVAGITPEDADAYTMWLSHHTGHPWRLPSEAEWEYAAKGPHNLPYPWGHTFDPTSANTRETGIHTTTPIGAFPTGRSPSGASDMGGNVEEFVADHYRPYPGGPLVDDHLAQRTGNYRVTRGGSFARHGDLTRTRRRHGPYPNPLYPPGFRLATSVQPVAPGHNEPTTFS